MSGIDRSDRHDQLVRLAYQDAFAPQPWKSFVSELALNLGSRDASLHFYTKQGCNARLLATTETAPHMTDGFVNGMLGEYFLKKLPAQIPMTLSDFGVVRKFRGSIFFKQYLAPFDITHILTQDVYEDNDVVIRLCADRLKHQGDFSAAEKQILQSITPHVRQAMQIRNRFAEVEGLAGQYQDLLSKAGIGCIVIGPHWEVLGINETANRVLQSSGCITTQRDQLRLRNIPQLKKLRLAIDAAVQANLAGAIDTPAVAMGVLAADGGATLNMVVKPLPSLKGPSNAKAPAALLLFNDGAADSGDIDAALLSSIYQLTRSEARLGVLLTRGSTLKEAAEQLHVSINTVKTQQQRIYEKLGLNRRSQMVNLLSKCTTKLV